MRKIKIIHDFLLCPKKVNAELFWLRKLWYILLLMLFSIYVFSNFGLLVKQSFVCQLDGNSLIFIIWLFLLILPLFDKIEWHGISLCKEMREQEEQTKRLKDACDEILNRNSIPSVGDLTNKFDEIIKTNKDE